MKLRVSSGGESTAALLPGAVGRVPGQVPGWVALWVAPLAVIRSHDPFKDGKLMTCIDEKISAYGGFPSHRGTLKSSFKFTIDSHKPTMFWVQYPYFGKPPYSYTILLVYRNWLLSILTGCFFSKKSTILGPPHF